MAQIFYVRDGDVDTQLNQDIHLHVEHVVAAFGNHETRYTADNPPAFGAVGRLSDYADRRHVVVLIGPEETCDRFPKSGYYVVVGLSVSQASGLLRAVDR